MRCNQAMPPIQSLSSCDLLMQWHRLLSDCCCPHTFCRWQFRPISPAYFLPSDILYRRPCDLEKFEAYYHSSLTFLPHKTNRKALFPEIQYSFSGLCSFVWQLWNDRLLCCIFQNFHCKLSAYCHPPQGNRIQTRWLRSEESESPDIFPILLLILLSDADSVDSSSVPPPTSPAHPPKASAHSDNSCGSCRLSDVPHDPPYLWWHHYASP